jgi:hypothetical protein
LRVLCERLEYLYGVLTVTPVSDTQTAWQISENIRSESQFGHLGGFQQVRCVEAFLAYLKKQFAQLKTAYPDFGTDRAGASFIIRQIESPPLYFRNPTNPQDKPNYLDERYTREPRQTGHCQMSAAKRSGR